MARYTSDRMSPSEAFSRGFYGGFGLWCSFMVINIIFAAVVIALLVSMGFIGAAATVPMGKPRSAYSLPVDERADAAAQRVERSLPLGTPTRRRQSE